jgi:hypothetical protein
MLAANEKKFKSLKEELVEAKAKLSEYEEKSRLYGINYRSLYEKEVKINGRLENEVAKLKASNEELKAMLKSKAKKQKPSRRFEREENLKARITCLEALIQRYKERGLSALTDTI